MLYICLTLADYQGLVRPMQLAAALTGLRVQGVPQDLVKRFFVDIASDDGWISIHDLCAKSSAAHAFRVCHAF
jgi:hypothetical protein